MTQEHNGSGVAVVTGSASGVGLATVARLRARGVDVIGVDLAETPDEGGPGRLIPLLADVADSATWEQVLARAERELGAAPTTLVLNAARLVIGTVVTLTEEDWDAVLDVNVRGAARALRTLLPPMARSGGGSVVFVASVDGLVAEQNLAAYCTSKGALLQLMRAVALDHAREGIRSNAVCPGAIDTPFFRRHVVAAPDPAEFLRQKTERHPLGRLLSSGDVADAVDFLASDRARGITGAALTVDAGLTTGFDFYPDQASGATAAAGEAIAS